MFIKYNHESVYTQESILRVTRARTLVVAVGANRSKILFAIVSIIKTQQPLHTVF